VSSQQRHARPDSGWEWFDVEADVGVRAWGPTRAEAYAQAALGVLALVVRPEEVAPRETREVRAQAADPEGLLVAWVDACLYVHEIEGFLAARVEVTSLDGGVAHGVLHGEPFDPARHRPGTVVKAATHHGVAVGMAGGRHEVRLVVDV